MSTVKAKTELFFSKHHLSRPFTACVLCRRSSVHMSHYAAFGDNERQFIKRHVNLDLAPESCICKAHQTERPSECGLTHVMFRNGIPQSSMYI